MEVAFPNSEESVAIPPDHPVLESSEYFKLNDGLDKVLVNSTPEDFRIYLQLHTLDVNDADMWKQNTRDALIAMNVAITVCDFGTVDQCLDTLRHVGHACIPNIDKFIYFLVMQICNTREDYHIQVREVLSWMTWAFTKQMIDDVKGAFFVNNCWPAITDRKDIFNKTLLSITVEELIEGLLENGMKHSRFNPLDAIFVKHRNDDPLSDQIFSDDELCTIMDNLSTPSDLCGIIRYHSKLGSTVGLMDIISRPGGHLLNGGLSITQWMTRARDRKYQQLLRIVFTSGLGAQYVERFKYIDVHLLHDILTRMFPGVVTNSDNTLNLTMVNSVLRYNREWAESAGRPDIANKYYRDVGAMTPLTTDPPTVGPFTTAGDDRIRFYSTRQEIFIGPAVTLDQ